MTYNPAYTYILQMITTYDNLYIKMGIHNCDFYFNHLSNFAGNFKDN